MQTHFASKGLYGVGGYDLYVSELDKETGDWSIPVNMGFPYSSPYNDFLLVNSEDGKYTFNALEGCDGCGRDIRLINGDVLTIWCGSIGYETMRLYDCRFDATKQYLVYSNKEYVAYVDEEYLITQDYLDVFWESSLDAGATFSRTVYRYTDEADWFANDTVDLRGIEFNPL